MPDIFRVPNGELFIGGHLLRVAHNDKRSGGVLRVLPIHLMNIYHTLRPTDVRVTQAVNTKAVIANKMELQTELSEVLPFIGVPSDNMWAVVSRIVIGLLTAE